MPEISRFLGIVIGMFYRDHNPPHFHATCGEYAITVSIVDGTVQGQFPGRLLRQVLDWHGQHREELLEDWHLAQERRPLRPIPPLE